MTEPTLPQRPGRMASFVLDLVSHEAEVTAVSRFGAYAQVTLAADVLRRRRWTPGDMIQIVVAGSSVGLWVHRSYTPFAVDVQAGTTTVLAYLHGNGPGSAWFTSVQPGERCHFAGPRAPLGYDATPAVLFGDESTISTALALEGAACVLEVDDIDATRAVIERYERDAELVQRQADDSHLLEVERRLLARIAGARCYLTGRAGAIQTLNRALRTKGARAHLKNLAYWAPGRRGFSGIQR